MIHLSCFFFFLLSFLLSLPPGPQVNLSQGEAKINYQGLVSDLKRCYFLAHPKTSIFFHTPLRQLLSPYMRKASGLCFLSILSSAEMKGGIIFQRQAPTEKNEDKDYIRDTTLTCLQFLRGLFSKASSRPVLPPPESVSKVHT